jgi:predicted phosphodiesterase
MATVLAIGDTHCPGMRRGYVKFLKKIAEEHKCTRVVHMGDLVDWHSISYHEHNTRDSSPDREEREAAKQICELVEAFPKADLMLGNHDALPKRKGQTAGLSDRAVRDFKEHWKLVLKEEHKINFNWKVHPRFSELEIDGVIYSHCEGVGGPLPALTMAMKRFKPVVGAHHHIKGGVQYFVNNEFRLFGLNVSTGIDRKLCRFNYASANQQKPMLGCGVIKDGKRAYYEPWLLRTR